MVSVNDFYRKLKRQYINFSLINAASLKDYLTHIPSFCIYYFFGKGKSAFPLNITLDLTYECNLDCKFCFLYFLGRSNFIRSEPLLTYREIKTLVTSLKGKSTTFLLTGGEPTLRKDFIDIVRLIKEQRFRCGIFTNATSLTPAISDDLIKYGLDYLFFSLDGPKDIHDRLRANGAFDKTYNNIGYISKKRGHPKPRIIMNVLMLDGNYDRLIEVIDIGCELKIDGIAFNFLSFLTNEEFNIHKKFVKEKFPEDEFKSLVYVKDSMDKGLRKLPYIIRDLKNYATRKGLKIFFKPDLKNKESKIWFSKEFKSNYTCIYPWNVLRISPYGDIYPCAQFYIKIGNIRDASIEEIWNNEKFCKFRRILKRNKLLPGCNKCCKL